jgi:hypothetical protein
VEGAKEKMREIMGDAAAIPPQFFNNDVYCGVGHNWVDIFF